MPQTCVAIDQFDPEPVADEPPPIHLIIPAAGARPPSTRGTRSVFELAEAPVLARFGGRSSVDVVSVSTRAPALRGSIERTDGVTRCVGACYPARWTAVDEERERARRARQRPPRPAKKARTRSRKLLDLIGTDSFDE